MSDRRDFLKMLGLGAAIPILGVKPLQAAEPVKPGTLRETPIFDDGAPSGELQASKRPLVFIGEKGRLELYVDNATLQMEHRREAMIVERGILSTYDPGPELIECELRAELCRTVGDLNILRSEFTFEFTDEKSGATHCFPGCHYNCLTTDIACGLLEISFICGVRNGS